MNLDYIPGKCMPGSGKRADELDYDELNKLIGMKLHPGTFNIQLDADVPYQRIKEPIVITDRYSLFMAGVGLSKYADKGLPPVPGWLFYDNDNPVPNHFVEVISVFNIRKQLKIEKWPSTSVLLALQLA